MVQIPEKHVHLLQIARPRLTYTSDMPSPDPSPNSDLTDIQIHQPLCAVFRRHLKSLGQKYTPERARVLDILLGMDGLFEADDLLAQMRSKGNRVSKATVYRTIHLLQDAGIISQVLIDDADQRHYQLAYGKRPQDLLIHVDSGEITVIDVPELAAIRDRICAERGLSPQGHRFMVYATCPKAPQESAESDT